MTHKIILIGTICTGLVGCSTAPGNAKQQGAVVGGATGAAVGATVTKNRALGAVIGGAVGAAGGYVIGGKTGTLDKKEAGQSAQGTPATTEQGTVHSSGPSADLNKDGFVTLDEIVSMEKSGLTDDEMIQRIQATGLTFDLNDEQRKYLSDHNVSWRVIEQLPQMNRGTSAITPGTTVIGK